MSAAKSLSFSLSFSSIYMLNYVLPFAMSSAHSQNLGFVHLSDHFFYFSKFSEDYNCHTAIK